MNDSHAEKTVPPSPRIVCFGDSITDGDTYPQIIMQSIREAGGPVPACICSGVGGDTAKMMDARFDRDVAIFKPDIVTVCAGGNDAAQNISPEDYAKAVRSIVARAKAIGAEVVLLTPSESHGRQGKTEAEKDEYFKKFHSHLDSYEGVIRAVAAETSCGLAENRKLMTESLKDGNSLFVEDNIHLNYLGQSLMARSILDGLGHKDVALTKSFDPKVAPGLVTQWMLRLSPLEKGQPIHLTDDLVSKITPDGTWATCGLPEKEPVADSPEIWLEQMRRSGAVMKADKLIGKGSLGQGVAEVTSARGGQAFIQTGMEISTIWLNGTKIHDQMKAWTGAHLGKERISVTLLKGVNKIVIEFRGSFFLAVTPSMIWEDQLYN
jgi:lysophospholipase L1-like esterase